MDMREFSSGVIKPEDLHDGPRVEKAVNIYKHEKHGCAVLVFESGDEFFCWNSYCRILQKAWGYDSDDWLGQELELSLGHYIDKKTDTEKETINVRAISPAKSKTENGGSSSTAVAPGGPVSPRGDSDDEIPF